MRSCRFSSTRCWSQRTTDTFTYDPGFTSTAKLRRARSPSSTATPASCCIAATRSTSWPRQSSFLEVCYLLLYGELPTKAAEGEVRPSITRHTMVHEQIRASSRLPPRRASDGGDVRRGRRAVGLLSRLTDIDDPTSAWSPPPPDRQDADHRGDGLQIPRSASPSFTRERAELRRELPAHVLRRAGEEYKVNPVLARAMDRIFILHADHEQNASTSTVRLAARRAPIRSPASRPASPACGARRMAAPTRRR
jgi:citrate synthase